MVFLASTMPTTTPLPIEYTFVPSALPPKSTALCILSLPLIGSILCPNLLLTLPLFKGLSHASLPDILEQSSKVCSLLQPILL